MIFKIMGNKGDAAIDLETIEMQQIKFDELMGSGLLPMVKDPAPRMLKSFEPEHDEVLWIPRIAGG